MALRDWVSGAVAKTQNQSPAVADLATPEARFTDATTYVGEPDQAAVDLADRILDFIVDRPDPVNEADIVEAMGGEPLMVRNVLRRLAIDGITEALPGGMYSIPSWPPAPANLPATCPLATGGPVPSGCAFDARMLRRLIWTGALPGPSGRCPLRALCKV